MELVGVIGLGVIIGVILFILEDVAISVVCLLLGLLVWQKGPWPALGVLLAVAGFVGLWCRIMVMLASFDFGV